MIPNTKYKQSIIICIIFSFFAIIFSGCESPSESTNNDPNDPVTTIYWTVDNSPYIITDTTVVDSGEVLIIEAGVTVKFEPPIPLIVRGTLMAQGTEEDSIRFTSIGKIEGSGNWYLWSGIMFDNCSDSTILEHCIIEHGGEYILRISDCSPTISHCVLSHILPAVETGGTTISCEGNSFPLIEYNIISDFSNYRAVGIACGPPPSNARIAHNDIYCNASADDMAIAGGGFLEGNYLAAWVWDDTQSILVPDLSLGEPVDTTGDGTFTTTSTDSIPLFFNVDGVKNPLSEPNFPEDQ